MRDARRDEYGCSGFNVVPTTFVIEYYIITILSGGNERKRKEATLGCRYTLSELLHAQ